MSITLTVSLTFVALLAAGPASVAQRFCCLPGQITEHPWLPNGYSMQRSTTPDGFLFDYEQRAGS